MSDYVKNESNMSDFEPVGNLIESVAAAGSFVGAAFLLAKTKKGSNLISNIDPLIGRIGNRITRFSDDGTNALTLNEIFNGISNSKFKTIEELAPAIDNERNIGFIKRAMSAEMDPRRSGEQFISQMYETSVKDSLNSLLPDAGTGGVEAINQMINEVGFNNVFDSAIGKFKPSFKQHVYDTMEGYYDGKKILKGGDSEQAFYKQLDSLVDDYKTLTKKEFSETQPVQDALTNFQDEFTSSLINEQNKIIESQLFRERITGLKGHTLGDFYEDVKSGRREYNGEFDVTLLTDKGLPVTKNFFDIMEDEKFAQLRDKIKDVNISDSYWTSEEGRVLNFKNFNELKNKTSEVFHDTLPAKLIGVDDIERLVTSGFDIFSKNDFIMYGKKYVDYGKNFTRIGDQAYQLDMSTGTLEKINAPDARWIRSDTRTVKSAKFASQHATNRLEEDKSFWQHGSSSIKNVTEEFGNNYNYFMRTDSSNLTIVKDPAIGTRVFGFKRAVEGIQIDLEDNTLNKIKNSLSIKDQNGVLGKLFDALEAENISQKKQIIKEFGDTEFKVDDLRTVHTAVKRGKRVKPKLASDEMSIANKSLYQKNSVKATINNSLKKEIINSLGDNKDEAFKRIDSLDISRAEKQKLKDAYSLEKFKQRTGLSSFRSEHDATIKGAPLGGSYARKIKEELEFDYDVQSAFNHYLGKGKDYKASYEQKHNDKRLVLVNNGLDIKDTLSKLNKLDAVGVVENGIKGLKGLLANTNQYSLLSTRYFPFNIYNKNVSANDMSVAGGIFYHMANRLSEGLNSMDLSTALGFVNQNLGETAAAKFNLSLPLGLSQRASGGALGILDNLLLKRVLPLSFALTQLDWADDTFNINENFQTGWANLDLAFRKFTDNTGLTNVLKLTKMAGPMFQYWGGDYRPYQSYDERLDYYQNGKDPIRSGRYWVWGSTNEFRGGSISYWEDNSLKLAQSDYRMESIYGGYFNKWMRSPIPTLSNPLSPLVYAMNPYWLEEKHMEDRPYLESGPLFEQNTLQGLILNPTLGELIKPKRKYHQDRMYNGRDVKAIMYHMNQQIQESTDNRYVIFQNGRLGVYDFTAFNHPNNIEYVQSEDNQYYGNQPAYASAKDYVNYINSDGSVNSGVASLQPATQGTGSAITAMNNAVHSGNGNPAGAYIQSRIRRGKFKGQIEDILNDADLYNNLMNSNGGQSYLDELQTTARLLTGIYGYGASSIFGRDESKFIANAGDIDSFTRSFWDAGIGGVGGEGAEIARRFLPEFSRRRRINPLLNTIAEQHPWLPEKFFTGDPMSKIINGEARLPGEGYEAINALHPDQFASDGYGAIDRYKILADIAPNSTEYKFWKQIVKMMNSDEAKKVLKDTEEMVKHQGKKHDFYDYKFLGKDTVALDGHVEEVLSNGKFKITGDDRLYQIAGVKFKDNGFMSKQQLLQVIQPGEHVTLRIDDEERSDVPGMTEAPIKAAMFLNGENISDSLRNMGLADYDMEDTSAAGAYANYGLIGRLFGSGAELLAHAQIPILHSQLMRINSPLEEYRSDQLYGAGFESWDDMLGSYILPTLEQSKTSFIRDMIADTTYRLYTAIDSRAIQASKFQRGALKFASTYLDGPALAGEIAGRFTFMGGNSSKYRDRLSKLGRGIGNTFALYTSTDDPMYAAYAWGRFGYDSLKYINLFPNLNTTLGEGIGEAFLGNSAVNAKGLAGDILESIRKTKIGRAAQVAAFAGVGLGISLVKNNPLTDALGINRVYTPDEVLKRWDTEDYFDRLRYIKYIGLYEAAKDKALKEEGVDVDKLYLRQEALRAEMDGEVSITDMMSSVLTSGTPSNDPMVQWINKRFGRLSDDMTTLAAGEYTEQAIMYHQVAESTVYALNKNSEYSDIIRALPSTEKEYFIEFAKVTSEKQRREILRNVSPSLAKALKLVWYQEDTEVESNESYFLNHNLPGPLWEGWSASSNMEDIKAKVIYNEGMTYADYGIYSSVYEDENVINAPNIEGIKDGDDPITVRAKLNTIMNGLALSDRQIKVNETSNDGIIDVFNNVTAVIGYKIDKALSIF
jgi:virion structural protein